MLACVHSVGVRGVEGYAVLVELDMANGLPGFTTVGLPDSAVREARERVTAAVRNSGYRFPSRRITVNLAPAQSRKQGTQYDLPIALAVLSASGQLPASAAGGADWSGKYCFIGELALDGALRPVTGVLAMAARAREQGFEAIVVPQENGEEATAAGIKTLTGKTLKEVADFINGGQLPSVMGNPASPAQAAGREDLRDVRGQALGKRALEVAAAGGHNILLLGPPGAGKSMLARRLVTILPPLTSGEAMEATRVHSACGSRPGLVSERPFRAPHHSASTASLIGGGPSARPGEVSLAHAGVLFLDEASEFSRPSLEALRQPLEDHKVVVSRARETIEYPARFLMVAASNPCPCGWRGHKTRRCVCTPPAVQRHLSKLSGPLLDRIDIQIELPALDFNAWAGDPAERAESSAEVLKRVEAARALQRARFPREDFAVNAYIAPRNLRRHCELTREGLRVLESASEALCLSARGLDRALRVARTIADLAGEKGVSAEHLKEAVQLRGLDRLRLVC